MGSTINRVGDFIGCTWSNASDLQPGATDTVETICAALTPLMSGDRSGIAAELQGAHHHILELLGGVEAERLFNDVMPCNTDHDLVEARSIVGLICRSPASVTAYLQFCRIEVAA
jgi:hypothetical protein